MTKKEKISFFVIAVIILVIFSCFSAAIAANNQRKNSIEWKTINYTVAKGDTLWRLAKEYSPEEYTINEYIALLKEKNHINNNEYIYPGQNLKILIPVYKEG